MQQRRTVESVQHATTQAPRWRIRERGFLDQGRRPRSLSRPSRAVRGAEASTPPPQGAIGGSRPPTPTYPPTHHTSHTPGQFGCPHSIPLARRLGGPRYRSASG